MTKPFKTGVARIALEAIKRKVEEDKDTDYSIKVSLHNIHIH